MLTLLTQLTLTTIAYGLILLYLLVFIGVALVLGWKYLLSNPLTNKNDAQKTRFVEENQKSESASLTLAGLAATGLTLILSLNLDRPIKAEDLIIFFSLGTILEILSALLYRHLYRHVLPYLGFVFQYGGLLCFLDGFFVFISAKYFNSVLIWIIYSLGIASFLVITGQELWFQFNGWRPKCYVHKIRFWGHEKCPQLHPMST
jgi:hypothetical protein